MFADAAGWIAAIRFSSGTGRHMAALQNCRQALMSATAAVRRTGRAAPHLPVASTDSQHRSASPSKRTERRVGARYQELSAPLTIRL